MIDYLISKLTTLLRKNIVDKSDIQYLSVVKKGINYDVKAGPDNLKNRELTNLLYYAVKFLSEQLEVSVTDTLYALIPIFKHIETGQDIDAVAEQFVSDYMANISDKVKIDA